MEQIAKIPPTLYKYDSNKTDVHSLKTLLAMQSGGDNTWQREGGAMIIDIPDKGVVKNYSWGGGGAG